MSRTRRARRDEEQRRKGPSHQRHKNRRRKKAERERELRDRWVTALYGKWGHGSCGRKRRFCSRSEMEYFTNAKHLMRPIWGYRCKFCGGWHLTRHPKRESVEL